MGEDLNINNAQMQIKLSYNMILVHNQSAKCQEMQEIQRFKLKP